MNHSITHTRRRALSTASLLSLTLAVSATGVMAQTTTTPAAPSSDSTVVVVTGFRQSYANAVKTKRDSIEITDSISSDGLGRFPDLNVGEAIQRIPGVQLNREADGRNATISLRGLPGSFARTTLNGIAFADPILSTATNTASTPLGAFNSDIFSSITVVKSPDASDLAGGLSGNVDLRIAPALQRKDGGFIKASEEYDTLGKLSSPSITYGFNKHFGHDFAIFGTIAANDEKFRRDSISVNTWANNIGSIQVGNQKSPFVTVGTTSTYTPGLNPVYDQLEASLPSSYTALYAAGKAPIYYPSQVRQFSRLNLGHMLSATTGFEWKVTDELKIGTTAFYTERFLDQGTNDLQYIQADGGANVFTSLVSSSAVAHFTSLGTPYIVNTPTGPRAYINTFSATNVTTYDSTRSEPDRQATWAVNPSIEFKTDKWKLTGTATISRANVLANQIELDVIENPYKAGTALTTTNGITTSIYTGGTDLSNAQYVLNTPNALHVSATGYPVASAASQATQAADALGNKFGSTGTNSEANNFLNAVQGDAERTFANNSFLSGVQFGARYEQDRFVSTGSRNTSLGSLAGNINSSMVSPEPALNGFFGGTAPGMDTNWLHSNVVAVLAAIAPTQASLAALATQYPQFAINPSAGVFLTPYGLVNNYWDPNYWNSNFTNANNVASAYVMAKFDTKLFNIPVRGNLGLRYEDTHNTVTALDCVNCVAANSTLAGPVNHTMTTRTYKQHYHYALPSFLMAADLTDDVVLRFAAYSTYVRPQPRDNVPITGVTVPEPSSLTPTVVYATSPTYTVTIGANNLKPYQADSYDLSLEWYNRPGGLIAIDAFQKNIKDYIGAITDPAILCPADGKVNGIDYGLGTLTKVGSVCQSSNTFVTTGGVQNATVAISGITNESPMTVDGIEFNIQQNLDFLPGFWKNFGGAVNYSYTTVSGRDASGAKITLPSVSKDNVNVIAYYETKQWGVRLVYNYRGEYPLAAGNSFVGDARTVKARSQLDASASYNINKNLTISADAFNLTDATRAEYENDPSLPRRIDYDGKTYEVTLRANF